RAPATGCWPGARRIRLICCCFCFPTGSRSGYRCKQGQMEFRDKELARMEKTAVRLWQGFWQVADPKIWVASTVPLIVATVLAWARTGSVDWGWAALGFGCIYLIEIGKNAVNDVIDYWTGVDRYIPAENRNDFS